MIDGVQELTDLGKNRVLRALVAVADDVDVHLVGGAIRDRLLGIESPDLDAIVSGNGRSICERLAEALDARLVLLGGDRFAAYRLVRKDLTLDLWDRQGAPLSSDLERRDFTVNAVALDLRTGTVHDPFDGLGDLSRRLLRVVTNTSFARDPLRVLRLVRFALLLPGFSIEPHSRELARNSAVRIGSVAIERTRDELSTVLTKGPPATALDLLAAVDLFPRMWSPSNDRDPATPDLGPTLERYEIAERLVAEVAGAPPNRFICVHTLIAAAFDNRMGQSDFVAWPLLSKGQARAVARLLAVAAEDGPRAPRARLARWGGLWKEAVAVREALTGSNREALTSMLHELAGLVLAEGDAVLSPRPLLDGSEIQELAGLSPGREVGRLLEQLLEAQLGGKIADRHQAREFVLSRSNNSAPDDPA